MSRALACSRALHAALVADDEAWSRLEPAGFQVVEPIGDEPGFRQEVRFCACGSTLARKVA